LYLLHWLPEREQRVLQPVPGLELPEQELPQQGQEHSRVLLQRELVPEPRQARPVQLGQGFAPRLGPQRQLRMPVPGFFSFMQLSWCF
jgi:hypothetical protein